MKQQIGLNLALYSRYLMSSFNNYTGSHLAEAIECSHDAKSRFLRSNSLRPRRLCDRVKSHLPLERRRRGALIFDDTVLDKNFSKEIEGTARQWSGNAHKIINGIGLVQELHYDPVTDDYLPTDYRVWDPERDGKSKHDHVIEMFLKAMERDFRPEWVLLDAWYASVDMLKLIHRKREHFFTRAKSNRLVSLPGEKGVYRRVDTLEWTEETLQQGQLVWLRAFGWVRVFRIVRHCADGTEEIQFYISNYLALENIEEAKMILGYRWKIEQCHRELKQLTRIERCQARKQRSQRNHIHCAIVSWLRLWERAKQLGLTVYQVKKRLLIDYLKHQMRTVTSFVCPQAS